MYTACMQQSRSISGINVIRNLRDFVKIHNIAHFKSTLPRLRADGFCLENIDFSLVRLSYYAFQQALILISLY